VGAAGRPDPHDVKRLARFRKVGHRITGDRQLGRSYGVGYDKVHVAVDDATRLAYVEVLADEQKPTVIGILSRAVAWFNGQDNLYAEANGYECRRVMSDNGPAYVSKAFAKACRILGLRHIRTPRPTRPGPTTRPNRFIQTLCREWAYAMAFQNSEERNRWLPRYLAIDNRVSKHSALGWRSPQQRLVELLR
jgi:transposase InsO family protein